MGEIALAGGRSARALGLARVLEERAVLVGRGGTWNEALMEAMHSATGVGGGERAEDAAVLEEAGVSEVGSDVRVEELGVQDQFRLGWTSAGLIERAVVSGSVSAAS